MDDSADPLASDLAPPDLVRVAPRLDPRLPTMDGRNGGTLYRGGVPAGQRQPRGAGVVRDSMAFARKMRKLADSRAVARALRVILCDPESDNFMRALEFVTERGYGRVPQKLEAEHSHLHHVVLLPAMDSPAPVTVVPAPPIGMLAAPVLPVSPLASDGSAPTVADRPDGAAPMSIDRPGTGQPDAAQPADSPAGEQSS